MSTVKSANGRPPVNDKIDTFVLMKLGNASHRVLNTMYMES
jgi:hypothetical protein